MSSTIVMYHSHYGSTKQYATWLSEALNADIVEVTKVKIEDLKSYDVIVYGGGLYGGSLKGIEILSKNFNQLSGKKIVVFTCGLADPQSESNIKGIHSSLDKVFTPQIKEQIAFYHVRGAINYKKLSFIHKMMMAILKKVLMKKDPETLSEDDKGILETYGKVVEFTNPKSLEPIIEYIKKN